MKTYERDDSTNGYAIAEIIDMAKHRWHPVLVEAEVSFDALFVTEYIEGAEGYIAIPALEVGGYPAAACVRITPLKDRAKGMNDVELIVDKVVWEGLDREGRLALIDHELTHIQVRAERGIVTFDPAEGEFIGEVALDDLKRPKLKLRKHDFMIGGFVEVANRHGNRALEVQQVKALQTEGGQWCWDFSAPAGADDGVESVTLSGGGKSVTLTAGSLRGAGAALGVQ